MCTPESYTVKKQKENNEPNQVDQPSTFNYMALSSALDKLWMMQNNLKGNVTHFQLASSDSSLASTWLWMLLNYPLSSLY